jgi:hypothetical protein
MIIKAEVFTNLCLHSLVIELSDLENFYGVNKEENEDGK